MPNPPAPHPGGRYRIPRLEPLERILVLLALAITFFAINGCRAGNGDSHLELADPKANALVGNIALGLPILFVLSALAARRSRVRSAALLLGIPVAILGAFAILWQISYKPFYDKHLGTASDVPCRAIALDGSATLGAYISRNERGTIKAVDVNQEISLIPGLVWKRRIFWASFAAGCPEMKRQDSQHVFLIFPIDSGQPEPQDAPPQDAPPQGDRDPNRYSTFLIDIDHPQSADVRR